MVSAIMNPEVIPGIISGITAFMSAWIGEQPRSSAASYSMSELCLSRGSTEKITYGMLNEMCAIRSRPKSPTLIFSNELTNANSIINVMPVTSYGSDADVSLRAGYDVRHALIGPGVRETHGYERTHVDALDATLRLVTAIVEA